MSLKHFSIKSFLKKNAYVQFRFYCDRDRYCEDWRFPSCARCILNKSTYFLTDSHYKFSFDGSNVRSLSVFGMVHCNCISPRHLFTTAIDWALRECFFLFLVSENMLRNCAISGWFNKTCISSTCFSQKFINKQMNK